MSETPRRRRVNLPKFALLVLLCPCFPLTASAQFVSISAGVGSLGFGGGAGVMVAEKLGLRAVVNGLSFSFQGEQQDIDYDFDVELFTTALLADIYILPSGLRFTAGAIINGNKARMLAELTDDVDIGGATYAKEDVGNLTGEVTFERVRPFMGMGLDTSYGGRRTVGFVVDVGVLLHDNPMVSLTADGTVSDDPDFQTALELERVGVEDDLSAYDVYPIVRLGICFRL